jgi:prepilin-type N-terminal cleavage/methylation domain-containing protein
MGTCDLYTRSGSTGPANTEWIMKRGQGTIVHSSRGFSLMEMLVVLLILSIVMSIIIPAIQHARTAARRADTLNLLNDVSKSCLAFAIDEKRPPGYFSPTEMGDSANASQAGFTGMENIMLDLIGGITSDTNSTTAIEVGPFAFGDTKNVKIEVSQMGGSTQASSGTVKKGYFQFDPKRFVVQNGNLPGGVRMPGSPVAPRSLVDYPVLVDTFGSPILAWEQDDAPAAADNFANTVFAANQRARFYWAANAGFVSSGHLGKLGYDQNDASSGSLLSGVVSPASRVGTLAALLGNPSAPSTTNLSMPASPRSPIVLHSAGQDGVYLGRSERGGKIASGQGDQVKWSLNTDPITGGGFDDLIQSAGN